MYGINNNRPIKGKKEIQIVIKIFTKLYGHDNTPSLVCIAIGSAIA
ncbi:MAG: hypothetical protein LBD88_00695 [Candidatus Peribacteria bacterium]|jgi:hypothetical protein|nr:hypothetical protein [Candidatus Peribacteria bacterium]